MKSIAERYRRFARQEAAGRSDAYELLAMSVAVPPVVLAFLDSLPAERQQPNLLFAALRTIVGTPSSAEELDDAIQTHAGPIADLMLTRTTQTNEPGRCAALMPVLARIKGPLALIEVGASAGLCLLPDVYGYDWGVKRLPSPVCPHASVSAPEFPCKVSDNTPIPHQHPEVVWRAGLDLNPLDVSKDDDVAWLETLVWPEHDERLRRLRQAIGVARVHRPRVVAGDLRRDLSALIAEAPADATVVVFHTAVLSYVSDCSERAAFSKRMINDPRVTWLSNESPRTFPRIAEVAASDGENMFLMAVDGRPQAWTGPHGQEIRWI